MLENEIAFCISNKTDFPEKLRDSSFSGFSAGTILFVGLLLGLSLPLVAPVEQATTTPIKADSRTAAKNLYSRKVINRMVKRSATNYLITVGKDTLFFICH